MATNQSDTAAAAGTNYQPTQLGSASTKPPSRKGWEAVKHVLYNKETGAILSRTPMSWFLITIYLLNFYACLVGFWYGILMIYLQFVPKDQPWYQTGDSLIGPYPILGKVPRQPSFTADSVMVVLKYDADGEVPSSNYNTLSNVDWAKRYDAFLAPYKYNNSANTTECEGDSLGQADAPACRFRVRSLGECGVYPYGYLRTQEMDQVEPCFLLKLNRIFNWVPKTFQSPKDEDKDQETNPLVTEKVRNLVSKNPQKVYIDCLPSLDSDTPMVENLKFYPEDQGLSFKYFPFNKANGSYLDPLVAIKFKNLPKEQVVRVECYPYYDGVPLTGGEEPVSVKIEIILM